MADAKIINYGQQISAGSTAIPDNTSEALDIESTDAKEYITIDTTDDEEKIVLTHKTVITDKGGASGNIGQIDTSYGRKADALVIDTADDGGMTILGAGNDPMTFNFVSGAIGDRSFINAKAGTSDSNQYLALGAGAVEGLRVQTSGSQTVTQFGQDNYDPQIEQSSGGNMGYTFKGDTNTGMTSGGGSDTLYLTAGNTQAIYISESGAIATTQINGPVSTVGAFATQGSGTVGTGGSSSTTLEQSGASTFQTELHVGAAIKIISGGVIKKATVASITDANTLELDTADTIADGSNWYHDSGELFAVKTGDSKTLFSVEPNRFLFESSNYNVVLGSNTAGEDLTTGDNNLFVGRNVGQNVTTGEWNTLIGNSSADGFGIIDPDRSVVVGAQAGRSCGDDNVYVGTSAGQSVIAGQNVGIGSGAMTVSGAERSVGIGYAAHKLCTGADNVAVGHSALSGASSGANNVGIGAYCMSAFSGADSVAIGKEALDSSSSVKSTAVGYQSLTGLDSGTMEANSGFGYRAGYGLDTGQQCTFLGAEADTTLVDGNNQTAIGYGAVTDAANQVRVGNTLVGDIDGQVALTATSDARVKTNIQDLSLGLDFINALRPVSFSRVHPADWPEEIRDERYKKGRTKTRDILDEEGNVTGTEEITVSTPTFDIETGQPIKDAFDSTTRSDGLIAQEVKAACEALGVDFNGIKTNSSGKMGIQYSLLVAPLIAAVKELSSQNESLAARIATLEAGD